MCVPHVVQRGARGAKAKKGIFLPPPFRPPPAPIHLVFEKKTPCVDAALYFVYAEGSGKKKGRKQPAAREMEIDNNKLQCVHLHNK